MEEESAKNRCNQLLSIDLHCSKHPASIKRSDTYLCLQTNKHTYTHVLSESLDTAKFGFAFAFVIKTVGLVYCSRDPQVFFFSPKTILKLGFTALFAHLKIILLLYFHVTLIQSLMGFVACKQKKINIFL